MQPRTDIKPYKVKLERDRRKAKSSRVQSTFIGTLRQTSPSSVAIRKQDTGYHVTVASSCYYYLEAISARVKFPVNFLREKFLLPIVCVFPHPPEIGVYHLSKQELQLFYETCCFCNNGAKSN